MIFFVEVLFLEIMMFFLFSKYDIKSVFVFMYKDVLLVIVLVRMVVVICYLGFNKDSDKK